MTGARGVAVMYHHVRPRGADVSLGICPLWVDEFEVQLDRLAEHFEIVDAGQLADILTGRAQLERPFCVLTFDDGTRDHAEVVTPILRRHGVSGLFFLLPGPWETRRLPTTHRLHVLLSLMDELELWHELEVAAGGREDLLGSPTDAMRLYAYENSPIRMRVKYAVNFALPDEVVDGALDALMAELDEGALVDEWFVTPEQTRAMAAGGMAIGSHGWSHVPIGRLAPTGAREEIERGHRALAALLGEPPRWYAPPFGGAGGLDDSLETQFPLLALLGYSGVFTHGQRPDPRLSLGGDVLPTLDRIDCVRLWPRGDLELAV